MTKKQWLKYNQNIVNRGNGITFTFRQAEVLVRLLNDISNFVLIMQNEFRSSEGSYDPQLFSSVFTELCRTCDELDTEFIYKMQDKLNGKRD